jgi:hypothetical protein
MSLTYTFLIATQHAPKAVLEQLPVRLEHISDAKETLKGPGFYVAARPVEELQVEILEEGLEEGLQIRPTVDLTFWINSDELDTASDSIFRSTIALLHKLQGDAVLLFCGEKAVFLRKGDQLYLNSSWEGWRRPEDLAMVDLPYAMKAIPVL